MASSGNQGNSTPRSKSFLHIVGSSDFENFEETSQRQEPLAASAQAMAYCMSADQGVNRIAQMAEKGFSVQSLSGEQSKLAIVFSRNPDSPIKQSLILSKEREPACRQIYRLGAQTLHHVSHCGQGWVYLFSSEKIYSSQRILTGSSIEEMIDSIKDIWRRDYRVTSIAGSPQGQWLAVASKGSLPFEQSFFAAADLESLQEKTKRSWKENRSITAIAHGEGRWLALLNNDGRFKPQKWFTRRSFIDVRARIREEWLRGFRVISLSHSGELWLVVASK